MVKYWMTRMRIEDDDDRMEKYNDWKIGVNGNFVAIGWEYIGNPTTFSEENKQELIEKLKSDYEPVGDGTYRDKEDHTKIKKEKYFSTVAGEILRFVNDISRGDIVVLPRYKEGSSKLWGYNFGRIVSDFAHYEKNLPSDEDVSYYATRWDVQWLREITKGKVSVRLRKSIDAPGTFHNIDNIHESEIEALLKDYT